MENKTTSKCLNCDYPIRDQDNHCPNCGQKTKIRNWSFMALINEFLTTLFNIDSKLFQTVKNIWIPGKLTKQYFLGQRMKYYHPMRLMIVSIFSFIGLALLTTDFSEIESLSEDIGSYKNKLENQTRFNNVIDCLNIEDTLLITNIKEAFEVDTLINDSTNFDLGFIKWGNLSNLDFLNKSPEEVIKEREITTWYEKLMVYQFTKMHKDPKGMFVYLMGNLSWATFGLILLMALFMKLLYVRGNYYYVEHFVLLSHMVSFLSIAGILVIGVKIFYQFGFQEIFQGLQIVAFFYGFIAIKKYYRQGWFKTSIKYLLIIASYLFFMFFFFLMVSLIGFLIF